MSTLAKHVTIYLESDRLFLSEDVEDLMAFSKRKREPVISFEKVLEDLKKDGKI